MRDHDVFDVCGVETEFLQSVNDQLLDVPIEVGVDQDNSLRCRYRRDIVDVTT